MVETLNLENQFGEVSENVVLGGSSPAANPTTALLTGLGAGTNTVILATDTILEALAKLQAQITALP